GPLVIAHGGRSYQRTALACNNYDASSVNTPAVIVGGQLARRGQHRGVVRQSGHPALAIT
ncbi:hypothetical protein ACGFIX_05350, partial [Nocardia salmonicida]|uniref:hypothetical protein n=1 Tax=Nocardia salmonicida TaxID=53431 RepID=UPI0037164E79